VVYIFTMDNEDYALRLQLISKKRYKRLLGPINPYRRNLRNLVRGNCLEVGCGIGRNLSYLDNSDNVGIDLNPYALDVAKSLGHTVMLNSEFRSHNQYLSVFDNLLFSHVLEHMDQAAATDLIKDYLPYLNKDGKLIIICPQKRGFDSDESHVEFMDFEKLNTIINNCRMKIVASSSHPLPLVFSKVFIYNEFVVTACKIEMQEPA